jgi:hypothetical protein
VFYLLVAIHEAECGQRCKEPPFQSFSEASSLLSSLEEGEESEPSNSSEEEPSAE